MQVRQVKLIAGTNPRKRRKNQATEEALKQLATSYVWRPTMEFFRGVAHHFNLEAE